MNLVMQGRLTVGLAVACGVSVLLVALFWGGVGSGYGFLPPDGGDPRSLPSADAMRQQTFSMPEFAHFAEITQRPLFSDDRRPIPPEELVVEEKPEKPPVPLKVQLTGVIITPDLEMALLQDQMSNKSVSLKIGMPLPGDQSAWVLVEINPREAVFKNNKDETSSVELKVSNTSGPPSVRRRRAPAASAAKVKPKPAAANAQPKPKPAAKPKASEDDAAKTLRERIEARRKELRERAEKIRNRMQNKEQE